LDISKEEINNDDEQQVPGNEEDNNDEPPKNKEYRSKIKTDSNDIEYISSTKDENINVLVTYYQIFDLRRIYTNSIHRMVQIFVDYMTYEGVYKLCNRFGLKINVSHFTKK
ncbi:unnamed protein product, partial [Rotaria socialis]